MEAPAGDEEETVGKNFCFHEKMRDYDLVLFWLLWAEIDPHEMFFFPVGVSDGVSHLMQSVSQGRTHLDVTSECKQTLYETISEKERWTRRSKGRLIQGHQKWL